MTDLSGRTMIVTGAGSGIGAATTSLLAERGARVIAIELPDRDGASLARPVVDRVIRAGGDAVAVTADVTDPAELESAVDRAVERYGAVTGVFANAGVLGAGTVLSTDTATWARSIDVNVTGVWNTVRASLRHFVPEGGSIVLTSSVWGLKGLDGHLSYAVSKHAVVGMMRAMAVELGSRNIRVNCVHPTTVDTPLVNNEDHAQRWTGLRGEEGMRALDALYRSRHLLPVALVDPLDVAHAVAWLLSDEARWTTGASLPVDGGLLAK